MLLLLLLFFVEISEQLLQKIGLSKVLEPTNTEGLSQKTNAWLGFHYSDDTGQLRRTLYPVGTFLYRHY